MSVFQRIDPDHPLARAAREVNDHADAHELPETLEWLRIGDAGDLAYLGEQRALRAVAAAAVGLNMGSVEDDVLGRPFDERVARAIIGTPLWRDMRMLLIGCYMDAFAIGWKGRELADGPGGGHYERPADVVSTVFDPADATFGPIMAAIQAGEFEQASRLLQDLSTGGASVYARASGADLAHAYREGVRLGDHVLVLYTTNEIVGRLDLPPDETEQGLTDAAQAAVDAWVAEQLGGAASERARVVLGPVEAEVYVSETDGKYVVQIDTTDEDEDEVSQTLRVYLNDARAASWVDDASGRRSPGAKLEDAGEAS